MGLDIISVMTKLLLDRAFKSSDSERLQDFLKNIKEYEPKKLNSILNNTIKKLEDEAENFTSLNKAFKQIVDLENEIAATKDDYVNAVDSINEINQKITKSLDNKASKISKLLLITMVVSFINLMVIIIMLIVNINK